MNLRKSKKGTKNKSIVYSIFYGFLCTYLTSLLFLHGSYTQLPVTTFYFFPFSPPRYKIFAKFLLPVVLHPTQFLINLYQAGVLDQPNHRGSYIIVAIEDKMPFRFSGCDLSPTTKLKVSACTSQRIPRAQSVGKLLRFKSKTVMAGARCSGGKASRTLCSLDITFMN